MDNIDQIDQIAQLITEDPDVFEERQILLEAAGDIYEDAWVVALKAIYPFVHKVPAHIPNNRSCYGCWDSRGVDIFYSSSTPTNTESDILAQETVAQVRARGGDVQNVVHIPADAKMLQVKSSIDGGITHTYKWSSLKSKGRSDEYKPVVVGKPPKGLTFEDVKNIESVGYFIPQELSEENPTLAKELANLSNITNLVLKKKRAPLTGEELRKIKDRVISIDPSRAKFFEDGMMAPAETPEEQAIREKSEKEAANKRKVKLAEMKKAFLQSVATTQQYFADRLQASQVFMDKGRSGAEGDAIRSDSEAALEKFRRDYSAVKALLDDDQLEQIESVLPSYEVTVHKIKEKTAGRKRRTKTGTKQGQHEFAPRMMGGRPLIDRTGKMSCIYKKDKTSKLCRNDVKHKSHMSRPHPFRKIKLPGKRGAFCGTCWQNEAQHNKRQTLPESFIQRLNSVFL